jgi:hypothetical protein
MSGHFGTFDIGSSGYAYVDYASVLPATTIVDVLAGWGSAACLTGLRLLLLFRQGDGLPRAEALSALLQLWLGRTDYQHLPNAHDCIASWLCYACCQKKNPSRGNQAGWEDERSQT